MQEDTAHVSKQMSVAVGERGLGPQVMLNRSSHDHQMSPRWDRDRQTPVKTLPSHSYCYKG